MGLVVAQQHRIATLETLVPRARSFVLHGVLPLPDLEPAPPGRTHFAVRLEGGGNAIVPAQVEVVASRANGTPQAVELLAPIELPDQLPGGERGTFEVLYGSWSLPPEVVPEERTRPLLIGEAAARLVAIDPLGRRYSALIGGAPGLGHRGVRMDREGHAASSWRTSVVLQPEEAVGDSRPSLAAHAYWTLPAGGEHLQLDLRVHAGLVDPQVPSLDGIATVTYVQELRLELPRPWSATPLLRDAVMGAPVVGEERIAIPILAPLPRGTCHALPSRAQLQRRFTVHEVTAPPQTAQGPWLSGLAFPVARDGEWSWSTKTLRSYFPHGATLPTFGNLDPADWSGSDDVDPQLKPRAETPLALRGANFLKLALESERDRLRRALEFGVAQEGLLGPRVGWSQAPPPVTPALEDRRPRACLLGHRIAAAASQPGYERLVLLHRSRAGRQPTASWSPGGKPLALQPTGSDRSRPTSPGYAAVLASGRRPRYDRGAPHLGETAGPTDAGSLWSWRPFVGEHLLEWTQTAKALVWLGNDALAKDDLLLAAAQAMGIEPTSQAPSPDWLARLAERARLEPSRGADIGSEHAFALDAVATAWCITDPRLRSREQDWMMTFGHLLGCAATSDGVAVLRPSGAEGSAKGVRPTRDVIALLHARRLLNHTLTGNAEDPMGMVLRDQFMRVAHVLTSPPTWNLTIAGAGPTVLLDPGPDPGSQRVVPGLLWEVLAEGIRIAPERSSDRRSILQSQRALRGAALQLDQGLRSSTALHVDLLRRCALGDDRTSGLFVGYLAVLEGRN